MQQHAMPSDLRGKRVLVYTLGMEGRDLARFFVARGASVTVSDTRTPAQLAAAGAAAPEGVERVVSGQPFLDAAGFDLVATGQSVLRHDPAMARARELGIPTVSQMQLFLELCPASVLGITGSSGKSTTTALVGLIAEHDGRNPVIGGNIGEALLGRLDEIGPDRTLILEISHTQLQYTTRSPHVAAITNVTPNHLDQFSWDAYVGLKRNIIAHQSAGDIAVLNADDPTSRPLLTEVRGSLATASIKGEVKGAGAWFDGRDIRLRTTGRARTVAARSTIRLRGEHNLANVVMACAVAGAAGFSTVSMASAIAAFPGVPHRLEVVGVALGATWINDSIATSPERTMAGLRAFSEPVVLLLGGRDKQLPLDGLQALARERCRAVICFGEAGPLYHDAVKAFVATTRLVATLADAVEAARSAVRPGDVVLLSPAGTSFDAFPSFEVRGQAFRDLVRALPGFQEAA